MKLFYCAQGTSFGPFLHGYIESKHECMSFWSVLSSVCFLMLQNLPSVLLIVLEPIWERALLFSPSSLRKECVTRASLHSGSECVRGHVYHRESRCSPKAWGRKGETGESGGKQEGKGSREKMSVNSVYYIVKYLIFGNFVILWLLLMCQISFFMRDVHCLHRRPVITCHL